MEVLKGEGFPWYGGVAIGKLCFSEFLSAEEGDALIWVCPNRPVSLPSPSVVGVVTLCPHGAFFPLPLSCPTLNLSCLDRSLEGRVAILDPSARTLFVCPDLETLSRYASMGGAAEAHRPLWYRGGREDDAWDGGGDGLLLWEGDEEDEERLFARYRALAEAHPDLPQTVCVSFGDSLRLYRQIRAVYRGAVFGSFSLLFSGISTYGEWTACRRLCHEAFCDLESEGREFNGYLPRGFLLDRGLSLLESWEEGGPDFVCVDAEALFFSLTGGAVPSAERVELLCARVRAFRRGVPLWLWVREVGECPVSRLAIKKGGLVPYGVFLV